MNFMRFKWLYFLISAIVIIPGLFSLLRWGLLPSIDFTGGTILELQFKKINSNTQDLIRETMEELKIGASSMDKRWQALARSLSEPYQN